MDLRDHGDHRSLESSSPVTRRRWDDSGGSTVDVLRKFPDKGPQSKVPGGWLSCGDGGGEVNRVFLPTPGGPGSGRDFLCRGQGSPRDVGPSLFVPISVRIQPLLHDVSFQDEVLSRSVERSFPSQTHNYLFTLDRPLSVTSTPLTPRPRFQGSTLPVPYTCRGTSP